MPRKPRKLTTAALGNYHIRWLRDLANQEGNRDLASTCDVALVTGQVIRRSLPANVEAWAAHCPMPRGWTE
jgi:hypothetical protein